MGNKGSANSEYEAKFKAKEWQWQLKTEVKHLDREVKKIQADEARLQKEIQACAQKGDVQTVQMLAKSVVKSRKAVKRLEKTKASMHAVNLQLTTSIATMNTSSSLRLSADVMRQMNAIARIPEVGATMEEMRREMARCADAEDAMEEALREDGEEEEAAVEVQKVLEEMALDKMGPLADQAMPDAATSSAAPAPAAPVLAPPPRQLIAEGVSEPQRPAPGPKPPAAAAAPAPAPAPVPAPAPTAPAAAQAAFQAASADAPMSNAEASSSAAGGGSEEDELMRRLRLLKEM